MYADDTTFLCLNNDPELCISHSETIMKTAADWFRANAYLLNEQKTQHLVFCNNYNFKMKNNFDSVKFLGIRLDDNLTWSSHIEDVSSRLSRVIFLLRNLNNFITPVYARSAYFSFFQSVFRYGLIFWGNCSRIREILILQKKQLESCQMPIS